MKLTLTYVNRTQRTSASGKPFTSLSLKAQEYGESYLSGFGSKANENWQPGQVVEVAEIKTVNKNGKTYYNFEMPKKEDKVNVEVMALSHKIDQLGSQLRSIIDHLSGKNRLDRTSDNKPIPFSDDGLDQINPDEIPL